MSQGICVRLQTLNGQQPHKQTHMCTGCSVQTWDATVQKKREKECKKKECKMVGVDSALKKKMSRVCKDVSKDNGPKGEGRKAEMV